MNTKYLIRIFSLKYIRILLEKTMNVKLTLRLNKRAIDGAKKYARKNKQSLSMMVEKYFNLISDKDSNTEMNISPNVLELSGIVKLPENINIKEVYGKHLEEKYSK